MTFLKKSKKKNRNYTLYNVVELRAVIDCDLFTVLGKHYSGLPLNAKCASDKRDS